ncbi:MAG TPA: peptidylprolyl isomerase [Polyangiaceae bacterium]|jgi:hypothetical protein
MKRCVLLFLFACGGGAGVTKPAATADDESPAANCLRIADAPRARKADEPSRVTVKHVLVKWAGAKNAPESITRTREAACLRADDARTKLEQGASFADVVKEYSDEPGAATREGLVGQIERRDVNAAFADAAFELKPGDVSYVVESPSGFHVIMRTE